MLDPDWMKSWLALSAEGIADQRYWQFCSFMLLHAAPLPFHLLSNILVLYFAGREVEPIIGSRHFCALYLLGNLLGAGAHFLAMGDAQLIGVSAGVAAVLAAYATILPELEIRLNLLFVLPLRLRAKYLGLALVGGSGLLWLTQTATEIRPGRHCCWQPARLDLRKAARLRQSSRHPALHFRTAAAGRTARPHDSRAVYQRGDRPDPR
jgi:hypothetical protein